jgi:dipeptidyl-peptidase-3
VQGSGDQKFVPRLRLDSLGKFAQRSARLKELFEGISRQMLSVPPYSLGYPGDQAQSAYYPGDNRITRDEIAAVSRHLEGKSIFPENTRIHKVASSQMPIFEILQASVEKDTLIQDTQIQDFGLPGSVSLVKLVRGDHSQELEHICAALDQASEHAANNTQKLFISQYIDSFRTGSLDVYRDSQRTWINDKNPRVENIFGFVEPYRDPHGIRAEFEGLVAITDAEQTKLLLNLVEHSTQFIRLLPWANTGSTENDGKGPFEKALLEPPDFTSLHGMHTSCDITAFLPFSSSSILL